MDCHESITLLSEYRDGVLIESITIEVRAHLDGCPPCADIYRELDEIVHWAVGLRENPGINFPDENVLWQRMRIAERKIH